jgi:hypothetical protein
LSGDKVTLIQNTREKGRVTRRRRALRPVRRRAHGPGLLGSAKEIIKYQIESFPPVSFVYFGVNLKT